jgi:hypothetical protein
MMEKIRGPKPENKYRSFGDFISEDGLSGGG